ncbi:MAG: hypothetical protein CMF22_10420 [Idiomarinaceae bacterium]|nr:hypothetical protein [Idiomarinaceae bacterium]MBG23855.1 hypothetical protein [Idiomarinaceae bacterium]|tara:strand:- start:18154 stop:18447 length:294 start_codon:yes stop_codon:yes gene_type:complete
MTTQINEAVMNLLLDLSSIDFTDGFEDTVPQRVRNCIAQYDQFMARNFWSLSCCGMYRQMLEEIFDGDEELMEIYLDVKEYARENGFRMPDWGTRGT